MSLSFSAIAVALYLEAFALATPVLWDGFATLNYTDADIDASFGPYLRYS
jgi:hypothetical protein